MRLSRRALVWTLLGAAVSACLSPTLPMPPPSPPDVEPVGQGQYRLRGGLPESGTVLVLNFRTERVDGQLANDAVYDFTVPALPGDHMQLWYVNGNDASEAVGFDIPQGSLEDGGASSDASDAGKD